MQGGFDERVVLRSSVDDVFPDPIRVRMHPLRCAGNLQPQVKLSESIQGFVVPIGARQTSAGSGCGWGFGAGSFNRDKTARANADASAALPGDVGCETDAGAPTTYAKRQALSQTGSAYLPANSRTAHPRWGDSRTILPVSKRQSLRLRVGGRTPKARGRTVGVTPATGSTFPTFDPIWTIEARGARLRSTVRIFPVINLGPLLSHPRKRLSKHSR